MTYFCNCPPRTLQVDALQNVIVATGTETESHDIYFRYSQPLSVSATSLHTSCPTPDRLPQAKTTSPLLVADYGVAENVIRLLWAQLTSLVTPFEQSAPHGAETWTSHTDISILPPWACQPTRLLGIFTALFFQILTFDLYFVTPKTVQFDGRHTLSLRVLFVQKGPAAESTEAPQPWGLLCNPVVKSSLESAMKPHRGSRGIALLFL